MSEWEEMLEELEAKKKAVEEAMDKFLNRPSIKELKSG